MYCNNILVNKHVTKNIHQLKIMHSAKNVIRVKSCLGIKQALWISWVQLIQSGHTIKMLLNEWKSTNIRFAN